MILSNLLASLKITLEKTTDLGHRNVVRLCKDEVFDLEAKYCVAYTYVHSLEANVPVLKNENLFFTLLFRNTLQQLPYRHNYKEYDWR